MLSVIIPTRNRAAFLKDALESVLSQTLDQTQFEVIVVDNGSTDNTCESVEKIDAGRGRIRYIFAPEPGLHVGRHAGAQNAKGEILVFTDDDIIASPQWLESIRKAVEDKETVLVGGKILPKWEGKVPPWINALKSENRYGWVIGFLSLLDFGDNAQVIPAKFVYGCNFSIRKKNLYECGGFHPDAMPQELIKYRGDGETGLTMAIEANRLKTIYEPKAMVYHRVPKERLTFEYLRLRSFNDGISHSYADIRRHGGIDRCEKQTMQAVFSMKRLAELYGFLHNRKKICKRELSTIEHKAVDIYENSNIEGQRFHRQEVEKDPELLKYILKERYF